eukprot:752649-Hanusia_phi.AAC.1
MDDYERDRRDEETLVRSEGIRMEKRERGRRGRQEGKGGRGGEEQEETLTMCIAGSAGAGE